MADSASDVAPEEILRAGAAEIGLPLQASQVRAFQIYAQELLRWNRRMNLARVGGERDLVVQHFLPSLAFAVALGADTSLEVLDVGSGAGFPGLPLAIACPRLEITLLDASRKKTSFLRHVCWTLDLKRVTCIRARAEHLGVDARYRERFPAAIARATAKAEVLLRIVEPLLRPGGSLILNAAKGARRPEPAGSVMSFAAEVRVRFSSVDLQRDLQVWKKAGGEGGCSTWNADRIRYLQGKTSDNMVKERGTVG